MCNCTNAKINPPLNNLKRIKFYDLREIYRLAGVKLMQVCNTSDADRSLAKANRFFALLKKVTLGLLESGITG